VEQGAGAVVVDPHIDLTPIGRDTNCVDHASRIGLETGINGDDLGLNVHGVGCGLPFNYGHKVGQVGKDL